jgi:hypothetical protein
MILLPILGTATIGRDAKLLTLSRPSETCSWHVTSICYQASCCAYQIRDRVEFMFFKMRILIESDIVGWICGRELVCPLAMWGQSIAIYCLLHLGPLSFRRVLLSLRLKIFARSLRSLQLYALKDSMIASTRSSLSAHRHKYLVSRTETIFKYLWLRLPHFNAESTLTVTLRALTASGCRMIIMVINNSLLSWMMMSENRLNQKLRIGAF